MAVFTWERITFRKTFRIAIQNVIGIVIWTMCVHMHCKRLPNHDQDLRTASDILFLWRNSRWLTHALLQHGFSVHFQNAHARITFRKSFAFSCPRIRLSTRITIQNAPFFCVSKRVSEAWFKTALRSQRLYKIRLSQIRKGANHVLKCLSECDSFSCEQAQCL